jgi:hypothetical protein
VNHIFQNENPPPYQQVVKNSPFTNALHSNAPEHKSQINSLSISDNNQTSSASEQIPRNLANAPFALNKEDSEILPSYFNSTTRRATNQID